MRAVMNIHRGGHHRQCDHRIGARTVRGLFVFSRRRWLVPCDHCVCVCSAVVSVRVRRYFVLRAKYRNSEAFAGSDVRGTPLPLAGSVLVRFRSSTAIEQLISLVHRVRNNSRSPGFACRSTNLPVQRVSLTTLKTKMYAQRADTSLKFFRSSSSFFMSCTSLPVRWETRTGGTRSPKRRYARTPFAGPIGQSPDAYSSRRSPRAAESPISLDNSVIVGLSNDGNISLYVPW